MDKKILVLIPCYNEEENIVATVEHLQSTCPQVDFLVINDCSTDHSADILRAHHYPFLDLPVNLASGVARMELLGNRSLYVDRHRGVLSYSTEAVDVNAGTVVLRVTGEELELAVMTDEELRINGTIRRLELVE